MKCELLKRTAIALFVGSIVSTYAMAEDDTTNTLKSAVSKLATGIQDNLLPAIATNRTDIDKNTSNIKELAVGIQDNILPALEANRTDIDANKAAIGELAKATDEAVTNLGNAVSGLDEDLAGTQDAVAENRKDIDKNTSNIKELAVGIQDNILPALEANRTDIDANKADVETLKNRADGAAAAVNLLAQNIALNKTNIESKADQDYVEGLEQDVKINTSDIKELSVGIRDNILPALEANRTDIDKNASRITDTRNKQVLQNARLDNHSSRIDANKAALETKADKTALEAKADKTALEAKADKTALEAKADKTALEAKADKTALEAKADKTALEAKADKVYVGSLEQNIRDNSNRIETNKVAVSALRNDINSHAKRLDHLDNRVNKLDKDLKRGLATQAALTGLFQPYTVGKANFTAAVGGYKSQTAVAIGTGYRYNKHVATKAGVAFTQGGAAYNVGVNFEW
ncbi:YadA-like family protein [Haemophilus parahaemolyticus]|uniref:YadA C-terminal domain-containing protein n=1 Tax=Haemophilus parahaemolyticus TaxID=735 RepID=UPI0028D0E002|nr:YadA-like family protein [Haemophilus parahaemolyticus]